MIRILFKNQGVTCSVPEGETILAAARSAGVVIESPCDGMGTCGKCRVSIENIGEAAVERGAGRCRLGAPESAACYVLACQTRVFGDITVVTESTESQNKTLKIVSDGCSFEYGIKRAVNKVFDGRETAVYYNDSPVGSEPGNTASEIYGLSVDIGTTTVVTALVDMIGGQEIASVSALNPQSLRAQDVLTRIKLASDADGLRLMYTEITGEINAMIGQLVRETGVRPDRIYEAVYSGNTAMIHLACNVDPAPLGRYPYTSRIRGGNSLPADGLTISPFGRIYLPPIISSYVGPDITSGVLVCGLKKRKGTTVFIDIGTNGEMVIAKDGSLSATSTAAGPAFEGMNITFGMRAGQGAIERFEIPLQSNPAFQVIGGVPASGICGSGLLDIVGELVRVGILGANGKFQTPEQGGYDGGFAKYLKDYQGRTAFEAAPGVFLTQKDVRQVQLAKGAVRAGVEALLLSEKVTADQVDRVLIAGSFGYHLKADSLIHIGLLPSEFAGKIEFVGNTSKTGGRAFLLNTDFRSLMEKQAAEIKSIELANRDDFDRLFIRSLNFRRAADVQ